jgi:protein-L-isoaspartate O-methyltransferase
MRKVPRAAFVPLDEAGLAYDDAPVPMGMTDPSQNADASLLLH